MILVFKAEGFYGFSESLAVIFLGPFILYRIIFGRRRYILIPVVAVVLTMFVSPWFIIAVVAWHVLYSICLGKAYDASVLFISFLIFVPGISVIVLAFSNKYDYQGPVSVLFFLER
jgi:hypothetical protein